MVRKRLRREPEIDFQSAVAAGLAGLPDPEVLALAASEGRLLVSHDESTMPQHFADFITSQTSAGLLIVSQELPLNLVVEELVLIWAASTADEWVNRICYLPI
ncbi:MAG TPA: DUF5615 family PIN-like protein [Blastocatellia bacterium]|nr:DUF5615 family PIN-like protein [Blastocatellia bacterium]